MSDSKIIELVKIQSWYVPRNALAYQTLRKNGIPLLKVHMDMLDLVKLAFTGKGVKAKSVKFSDILEAKLDEVGRIWLKDPTRRCKITDKGVAFVCQANSKNKKMIAKMDNHLTQFFARWGYRYNPTYSEQNNKLKLTATFKFDPALEPVVPSVEPEDKQDLNIDIGFTRIKFIFNNKAYKVRSDRGFDKLFHEIRIFTKAGTDWVQVHSSTFTNGMVGDMSSALSVVALLHNALKTSEG